MQGAETDRVRTETGWRVQCAQCGTFFDSKRSDASYCSATCRVRAKREAEEFLRRIAWIEDAAQQMRRWSWEHRTSRRMYQAMQNSARVIAAALENFEHDEGNRP